MRFCLRELIFFVSLSLLQQQCFAKPGFYGVNSPEIPTTVFDAASSVFQIVILNTSFPSKINAEERKSFLTKQCSTQSLKLAQVTTRLNCAALRKCTPTKETLCELIYSAQGTAFVAGDKQTLWTAWHNVSHSHEVALLFTSRHLHTLPLERRLKALSSLRPEFLLYDGNGNLAYDSRAENVLPSYLNVGDPTEALTEDANKWNSFRNDFASIHLGRELGVPVLPLNNSLLQMNEPLFLIGYPTRTVGRANLNSDGRSLRITFGKTRTPTMWARDFGMSELAAQQEESFFDAKIFLMHDADVVEGMSGGPMIDSLGRVLGIIGYSTSDAKQYRASSGFGVRMEATESFRFKP